MTLRFHWCYTYVVFPLGLYIFPQRLGVVVLKTFIDNCVDVCPFCESQLAFALFLKFPVLRPVFGSFGHFKQTSFPFHLAFDISGDP